MKRELHCRKLFGLLRVFFFLSCFSLQIGNFTSPTQAYADKPINKNSLIFRSTDAGFSWSSFAEIGTALPARRVYKITFDPHNSTTIYLATNNGCFKSTDDGNSWKDISAGLVNRQATELLVDPENSSTLYALAKGFFKSRDGGNTWQQTLLRFDPPPAFATGNQILTPACMAIDPVTPSTLYIPAGGLEFHGVYKSTDGGESFRFLRPELTLSWLDMNIIVDPKTPSTLYSSFIGGANRDGIYKTTDGGEHWFVPGFFYEVGLKSFFMDAQNPLALYADTADGILKSSDGGENWVPINKNFYRSKLVGLGNSSTVFVYHMGSLIKSLDGGDTFTATNLNQNVSVLAFDLKNPSVIYGSEPLPPTGIDAVIVEGKSLAVTGFNIHEGAVVVINSEPQATKMESQDSTIRLIAKKAFKRMSPGQTVSVQIKEVDGFTSAAVSFTKPF